MRRVLFVFILLFMSVLRISAQTEDVMKKIAVKCCECAEAKDFANIPDENKEMTLGFCVLEAYNFYENELPKKDRFSFSSDYESATKFGEKIGMLMAVECPSLFIDYFSTYTDDIPSEELIYEHTIYGTIKHIDEGCLPTITVTDDNGKNYDFVWFSYFTGSDELLDKRENCVGMTVEIGYNEREVYHSVLHKFIKQNVIQYFSFQE